MPQGAASPIAAPLELRRRSQSLTVLFLAISFLASLAILSVRNIYDDEYSSLAYVDSSVSQIVHTANSADVHPPGMYLLARLTYAVIPSPRWMTLFPLCLLYAGLAAFLFAVTPLLPSTRSQACFLLLAALHPQLLMWGNTIRWYGWWTGLALIVLVVALQPGPGALQPRLTCLRSLLLGVLLACLFYLNYITFLFLLALGAAMLMRHTWRPWKQYVLTLAIFLLLILPQMHALRTVHLASSQRQRSGVLLSLARLSEGVSSSEAYLPWHPLAIFAALTFFLLLLAGVRRAIFLMRTSNRAFFAFHNSFASVLVFALAFFALIAISGLGLKPRNGLLLLPVLAPLLALLVETLRPVLLQYIFLGFFGLWSAIGIEHLLRREGLAKSNMNNRPQEVVSFLRDSRGSDCSVVITYDALLTLDLSASGLPRLLVLTPFQNPAYRRGHPFNAADCPRTDLYFVRSYLGGLGNTGAALSNEMDSTLREQSGPLQTHQFSFDSGAARKRKFAFLSGASNLPDYRYIVISTTIAPSGLNDVLQQLPHFAPVGGGSKPISSFSKPTEP